MDDRQLLDYAQSVIPYFQWSLITTEQFGTVALGGVGKRNGYVLMTETEFWLDRKSGKLSSLGEPILTDQQRDILNQAIVLTEKNRLQDVELLMNELFAPHG